MKKDENKTDGGNEAPSPKSSSESNDVLQPASKSPAKKEWPHLFFGEAVGYGGRRIQFQIMPTTVPVKTVRSLTTHKNWNRLALAVFQRAWWGCEICYAKVGAEKAKKEKCLAVLERWQILLSDNPTKNRAGKQTLRRLLSVCKDCYIASNPDLATSMGLEKTNFFDTLRKVNNWNPAQTKKRMEEAKATTDFLSKIPSFIFDKAAFTPIEPETYLILDPTKRKLIEENNAADPFDNIL